VWSDAQGGYPVDSGANNTKTMLLASADTQQGRLNVATTVKENSYTSRKADAQLLPKYKNDKTQFPTSPTNKAPNITARYDEYIRASIAMYEELRKRYGAEALMHFGTGKVLDLKGQYGLPKAGQYAVVHGKIFQDGEIANAQFGAVMNHVMENHPRDIVIMASRELDIKQKLGNSMNSFIQHTAPILLQSSPNQTKVWVGMEIAQKYAKKSGLKYDQPQDQAAIKWGLQYAQSMNVNIHKGIQDYYIDRQF
jgi:hypothetical protein